MLLRCSVDPSVFRAGLSVFNMKMPQGEMLEEFVRAISSRMSAEQ